MRKLKRAASAALALCLSVSCLAAGGAASAYGETDAGTADVQSGSGREEISSPEESGSGSVPSETTPVPAEDDSPSQVGEGEDLSDAADPPEGAEDPQPEDDAPEMTGESWKQELIASLLENTGIRTAGEEDGEDGGEDAGETDDTDPAAGGGSAPVETGGSGDDDEDDENEEDAEESSGSARYAVGAPAGDPSNVFIAQAESRTCTLAAATMMIRNFISLDGSDTWQSIGEYELRPYAWVEGAGLRGSFSYSYGGYSFSVASGSLASPSATQLKELLDRHPEGIVIYCGNAPHAVLLLDCEGDTFYCADSAGICAGKRIKLEDSWLSSYYRGQDSILENITAYWYIADVTSPVPGSGVSWSWDGDTLRFTGTGEIPGADLTSEYELSWSRYRDIAEKVTVGSGITSLPSCAFLGFSRLTEISLPDTLQEIGAGAFLYCVSLPSVRIPNSVETIGSFAFAYCSSLRSLTLPASLTVVPKGLCYKCAALEEFVLPENDAVLGSDITYGCGSLEEQILPRDAEDAEIRALQGTETSPRGTG